jgi:hypothetical protein
MSRKFLHLRNLRDIIVAPEGIEPPPKVPETFVLSFKLQGQKVRKDTSFHPYMVVGELKNVCLRDSVSSGFSRPAINNLNCLLCRALSN